MTHRWLRAGLAALALGATDLLLDAGPAAAQSTAQATTPAVALPATVTLDTVLRLLDTASPRVAAERAEVAVAEADRITARAWPNPSLSFGGARLASGLSTGAVGQEQLSVDQPLLLFGQRAQRARLADAVVDAERARVEADLAGRRLAVRQTFASLLARQDTLRLLTESRDDVARAERVVRGRADAGERSPFDVLRISTEGGLVDVELANAATDVTEASRRLAALVGVPSWRPTADGALTPGSTSTDLDALWASAERARPLLVAARLRHFAADQAVRLAHSERLPVPTLNGGVLVTHDVAGTSALFGISVPIPAFDRGRGPIARAVAGARVETLAERAEEAEARAEIEQARDTYLQRRNTLDRLERDVASRVPELKRMAEDAYREGRGDVLDLLDALRAIREIRLQEIRQLEACKLAEEALIAAAGLDAPAP